MGTTTGTPCTQGVSIMSIGLGHVGSVPGGPPPPPPNTQDILHVLW